MKIKLAIAVVIFTTMSVPARYGFFQNSYISFSQEQRVGENLSSDKSSIEAQVQGESILAQAKLTHESIFSDAYWQAHLAIAFRVMTSFYVGYSYRYQSLPWQEQQYHGIYFSFAHKNLSMKAGFDDAQYATFDLNIKRVIFNNLELRFQYEGVINKETTQTILGVYSIGKFIGPILGYEITGRSFIAGIFFQKNNFYAQLHYRFSSPLSSPTGQNSVTASIALATDFFGNHRQDDSSLEALEEWVSADESYQEKVETESTLRVKKEPTKKDIKKTKQNKNLTIPSLARLLAMGLSAYDALLLTQNKNVCLVSLSAQKILQKNRIGVSCESN